MSTPEVGIQLIIFGERARKDLEGVMSEVKAAGYDGIETGNLLQQRSEDEVKGLFQRTGLQLTGAHSGYGDFEDHHRLEQNVAFLNTMGARYLMCSGVAAGDDLDAYQRSAETFNRAGEYCKKHGVTFCYHNHNWEFKRFPGPGGEVTAIHELCSLTDPDLVKLCIDVYWVAVGGEDPARFIARYSDRAAYFHFKDGEWEQGYPGKATRFLELGHGKVNLRSALDAALAVSPEWIVTEQDTSNGRDPITCARESRDYLRESLGL